MYQIKFLQIRLLKIPSSGGWGFRGHDLWIRLMLTPGSDHQEGSEVMTGVVNLLIGAYQGYQVLDGWTDLMRHQVSYYHTELPGEQGCGCGISKPKTGIGSPTQTWLLNSVVYVCQVVKLKPYIWLLNLVTWLTNLLLWLWFHRLIPRWVLSY